MFSQSLSIQDILNDPPEDYKEASHVVYEHRDYYTIDVKKGELEVSMDAVRSIIPLRELRPVFYTSTNSFSSISKVKGSFKSFSGSSFSDLRVEHAVTPYEVNGIFHSDFYINTLYANSSSRGLYRFQFTKNYLDYRFLGSMQFSDWSPNPTIKSTIAISYLGDLQIDLLEMNFEGLNVTKEMTLDKGRIIVVYSLNDLEYIKDCPLCPSRTFFEPHIIPIFKKYSYKDKEMNLMSSTENLYEWYSGLVNDMDNEYSELSPLVQNFKQYPEGIPQIRAVYEWVRDNIRYIAFEDGMAGFEPDECQDVFKKKYGDCKGMANLCKAFLQQLGYDARLAWLGTRDEIPYDYSIPSLVVDNHMITAVRHNGEFMFLDATEEYGSFGNYAYRIKGRPVLIEDGENYIVSNVPNESNEPDEVKYIADCRLIDGFYSCETQVTFNGEPKKLVLFYNDHTLSQDRSQSLEGYLRPYQSGDFEITEVNGFEKSSDSLEIDFSFASKEGIIQTSEELLLELDFTSFLENLELKSDRRANFHFSENYDRSVQISFEIPDGYTLDHVPESLNFASASFIIVVNMSREGNTLKFKKRISVIDGVIRSKDKDAFRAAHQGLSDFYKDRIILKKLKQ